MPKVKHDYEFWQSAKMNNVSYLRYYNQLVELSMCMFEWKGLPESVDVRTLELALLSGGQAVFFKDDSMGEVFYLALRVVPSGKLNIYREPIERTAIAENGYSCRLNIDNSVIIYNNALRRPSMMDIEYYAHRLYDLDRSIDVNAKAQKTPIIIKCNETQRLTMKNLYKEYDGNIPYIFADKSLDTDAIGVIRTDAPFVADKLQTLKVQIWNEALTHLGISNINASKKERMVTDEVTRNLGATVASRYTKLNARQTACKKINKMFGLNVQVDFRQDAILTEEPSDEDTPEGGETE